MNENLPFVQKWGKNILSCRKKILSEYILLFPVIYSNATLSASVNVNSIWACYLFWKIFTSFDRNNGMARVFEIPKRYLVVIIKDVFSNFRIKNVPIVITSVLTRSRILKHVEDPKSKYENFSIVQTNRRLTIFLFTWKAIKVCLMLRETFSKFHHKFCGMFLLFSGETFKTYAAYSV